MALKLSLQLQEDNLISFTTLDTQPNSRVEDINVMPFNTAVAANGGTVDFKNEISGGIDCKDFKRSSTKARTKTTPPPRTVRTD
ncbi:hypothetical protein QJS10_CPA07g00307 [Acorus calamus]|uniref:Uncharacterized protein n=1 Tax=Acorus calamus TaxID=4465 RepID=A0AAV9EIE4_ACOCL|nr:hypothetical protein QJS10_CPA07g00307 [Acorus calamus]